MLNRLKKIVKSIVMLFKEEKKIPIPTPVNAPELLKGKVALITGGSGGIGLAMAESFIKSGAKVIIAGTNEAKLKELCQKNQCGGVALSYIVIDVTDVRSMPEKIKTAAALFPENRIDILVNSAGVVVHSDFLDMSESEYDSIMDINFFIGASPCVDALSDVKMGCQGTYSWYCGQAFAIRNCR